MTNIEKIKAEIERLIERAKAERVLYPQTILAAKNYLLIEDYKKLISFINPMLKESVSEDLDKAAEEYGCRQGLEEKTYAIKHFKAGAQWSEKDKAHLDSIDESLFMFESGRHKDVVALIEEDRNWLKSLRPLPKKKVDEEIGLIAMHLDNMGCPAMAEKLRNLCDKIFWTPSEEQIQNLRCVISGCSYDIEPLIEMEKQLKAL